MDHPNTPFVQFTPSELAAIRQILDMLPQVPALAGLMVASTVGEQQLEPLALHRVDFGTAAQAATVTNNDINEPIVQFAPARNIVLSSAASLKYIATLVEYVRSMPDGSAILAQLEQIQIAMLCRLDRLFDAIPGNMTRCLTWIVEQRAEEFVITPFITCIPRVDFHVMYYTITRAEAPRVLKVVVGALLCEIPFEIMIPQGMDSMTIVIIAKPIIDNTRDPPEAGVLVMLYHDPVPDGITIARAGLPSSNMDTSQ